MNKINRLNQINQLALGITQCIKCPLCKSRRNAVPGEGNLFSGLFFLGEAPGKNEDEQGRPFVGLSGKFLNLMLEKAGISRKDIFVTGSVKCRPPKNRTPKKDELRICKENWLNHQIEIINPKIIVLLGKTAVYQILGDEINLITIHGQVREIDNRKILITFHPAAAMRFPKIRKMMEQDLMKIKKLI